ncbi:hypothetical protein ACJMK2_002776 [Sinanodonta woodiana]|uniref:DDE Tnp4 domain-containing protein n=1 Tax=Sinanodonta woodiana TaxID=1069815 RepID=A0ABD3XW82_SINWO
MVEIATCMAAIEFMVSDTDVFLDSGVQSLYTLLREERIKVENFCLQILPLYSDHQFRRTLRLPRNIFSFLLDVVKDDLKHTPHFGGRHPVRKLSWVVGAMDGSHIAIATPLESPHSYFNRKKFHSVVLQAICKPDLTFIDVCCNFGRYHVIADAAYPCLPWIMTPYRDNGHLTLQQRDYNRTLRQQMGVDIKDIDELNKVILAVCVLHNICLLEDPEQLFDDADNDDPDNPCLQPVPNIIRPSNTNPMGQLMRILITNNL